MPPSGGTGRSAEVSGAFRGLAASNGASRTRSSAASSRCWAPSSPVSSSRSLRSRSVEGRVDRGPAPGRQGDQDAALVLRVGVRLTSPASARRSIRFVIVPEVTSVARSSAPGLSW